MKRKLFGSLFLILSLMTLRFTANNYAAAPETLKGVWVWTSTVRAMGENGVKTLISDLRKGGFTDLFLLVKGMNGEVAYPSKVALAVAPDQGDLLKAIITEAHQNGIKVHAWLMVHGDAAWGKKYPEDLWVHLTNGPKERMISLLSVRYQQYIQSIVKELVANYDIDGIQLDGMRFTHVMYSFDRYMLDEAERRHINVTKVQAMILRDKQEAYILWKEYKNQDRDAVGWEMLRREAIANFAAGIKQIVKAAKRPLAFSVALMPEGATDPLTADIQYGQNYSDAAQLYDFIAPMAYWQDFKKEPQWVGASVVRPAVRQKNTVVAGLQAYEVSGSKPIDEATRSALANGAQGVIYFRYGSFVFAMMHFEDGTDGKTLLTVELTNRSETAVDTFNLLFKGTGLTPQAVVDPAVGQKVRVSNGKVSWTGEQLLKAGQTVTFTVAVEKNSKKKGVASSPAVVLSRRNRVFLPVCAIMQ